MSAAVRTDLAMIRSVEAGRKPLDLRFDPGRHVDRGAWWHVAIPPERVLPGRCPGRVNDARLRHEAEGAVRVPAGVHVGLAAGHLIEGAADVHGAGLPAAGSLPGHRTANAP